MKSLDLSPASIVDTDTDKDISEKQYSVRIQEIDDLYHARVDADTVAFKVPWTYKWIALLLVVSLPIGVTWTSAALGPLKNTLRNELGISNTQFSVITASDAIVNSIWPIIGGLFLDWFGPNVIVVLCTGIILIGSILSALATNLDVWRLLVGGHILMGLGTAVLDSAQQKFFYHWFGAGGLAFAFGLENAIAKISIVSGMTAIPIKNSTGWYGYSFWIPAGLCAASFLVAVLYFIFERFIIPKEYRFTSGRAQALATSRTMGVDKKKLAFGSLLYLPWAYWMLPMTQLLQSGAAGGFSTSSADIMRMRGYTEAVAGYLSSAQDILPILLSPVDRKKFDNALLMSC